MSHVMTSTTHHREKPIVTDSPMEIDRTTFHKDTRPSARASTASSSLSPPPEHFEAEEAARQRAMMLAKNRAASEDNATARINEFPLRVNTTSQPQPRVVMMDEAQACTCTPTLNVQPKVPRPCNSFILYRRQMQAETTSEHPGMPNPQISKIIAEKWNHEAPEVKAKWKLRAAEEAERHKQQHPGYQYKPKRKGSAAEPNTPKQAYYTDGERCTKCNGFRVLPNWKSTAKYDAEVSSAVSYEGQKRRIGHLDEDHEPHRERGRSSSPQAKRRRLPDAAGSRGLLPIQTRQLHDKRRSLGTDRRMPASAGLDGRYVHVDTPLPHQYTMAPPPRPGPGSAHPGSSHPGSGHPFTGHRGYHHAEAEGSLRLPPLKTAMTPAQSPAQGHAFGGWTPVNSGVDGHSASDKTPQEQIMSIPFARKSAVVGKICPTLSMSASRGAIIAIEGADQRALEQVSMAVEGSLIVCRDAVVTAWSNPATLDQIDLRAQGDEFKNLAPVIFRDILAWHAISKEITSFVTSKFIKKPFKTADSSKNSSPSGTQRASPNAEDRTKIPVALIKNGFSLTLSDKFACASTVALQNYQPLDHWQWMATLWRGIVGPDLVVHIRACREEDMDKLKTVEYQKALNVMIVRVAVDKGLSEATERRLNFEIIEWITDIWPKMSPRAE